MERATSTGDGAIPEHPAQVDAQPYRRLQELYAELVIMTMQLADAHDWCEQARRIQAADQDTERNLCHLDARLEAVAVQLLDALRVLRHVMKDPTSPAA